MDRENRRSSKTERWTSREEAKVWAEFYRRIDDPAVAADLMEQMEADREVKTRHLGLYLRCRQSLRREKMRRAKVRAVVHGLQAIVSALVLTPIRLMRKSLMFVGAVFMASLAPPTEPAIRQMRKIHRTSAPSPETPRQQGEQAEAKQA